MYRKWFRFLLSAMLLILLFAWVPASALTRVTLGDSVSYEGGYTTIRWDVSGEELDSYIVAVVVKDNGGSKQQMVKAGETSQHSLRTADMLPGRTYDVYVIDSAMHMLDVKTYTMPEAEDFADGKLTKKSMKVSLEKRKLKRGEDVTKKTKKIKDLVAADIESGLVNGDWQYGLRYTIKTPQLAKGREFFTTVAFESPDGFLLTVVAQQEEYKRVKNGTLSLYYYLIGDYFFQNLYKTTGSIPKGTYHIYLFLDGMEVNTSTFTVK